IEARRWIASLRNCPSQRASIATAGPSSLQTRSSWRPFGARWRRFCRKAEARVASKSDASSAKRLAKHPDDRGELLASCGSPKTEANGSQSEFGGNAHRFEHRAHGVSAGVAGRACRGRQQRKSLEQVV